MNILYKINLIIMYLKCKNQITYNSHVSWQVLLSYVVNMI